MSEFTITREALGTIQSVELLKPTNTVQITLLNGGVTTVLELAVTRVHQR